MQKATSLKFEVEWFGEPDAGLRAGSEEVTIKFKYGQPLDEDTIDYWQGVIADFYEGAGVTRK
jgi:hypothetical protein